jgi:hypothetical protein
VTRTPRFAIALIVVVGIVALVPRRAPQAASASPTIEQFLAPGTPIEIASAKKVDRIAWTAYEHGLRNVYTAAAPDFAPVRLTTVAKDDGVELSDIHIADDGGVVVFVRGTPGGTMTLRIGDCGLRIGDWGLRIGDCGALARGERERSGEGGDDQGRAHRGGHRSPIAQRMPPSRCCWNS